MAEFLTQMPRSDMIIRYPYMSFAIGGPVLSKTQKATDSKNPRDWSLACLLCLRNMSDWNYSQARAAQHQHLGSRLMHVCLWLFFFPSPPPKKNADLKKFKTFQKSPPPSVLFFFCHLAQYWCRRLRSLVLTRMYVAREQLGRNIW